jgi:hypothetical protein
VLDRPPPEGFGDWTAPLIAVHSTLPSNQVWTCYQAISAENDADLSPGNRRGITIG